MRRLRFRLKPAPPPRDLYRRLGAIVVSGGLVTEDQLDAALARQRETGERLGEALVAVGAISKLELADALVKQMAAVDPRLVAWGTESADVLHSAA